MSMIRKLALLLLVAITFARSPPSTSSVAIDQLPERITGLHLSRWSTDAPPWSLCDPIIATVTTFWSMRAGLEECEGETMRDAYRRFASGRCALREASQERAFDRVAAGHVRGLKLAKLDPDAPANLGTRWPEDETDRAILLAKLRRRVADELGHAPRSTAR